MKNEKNKIDNIDLKILNELQKNGTMGKNPVASLAKELIKSTKNDSSSDQTSGEQSRSVASSSQPVPDPLDDWSNLFNDGASSGSFGAFGDSGPFDDLGPLDDFGIFDL